jgi:hypothetical protein
MLTPSRAINRVIVELRSNVSETLSFFIEPDDGDETRI